MQIRSPKPLRNKPSPIQTNEAKLHQSTETLSALSDWYFEKEDEKTLSKYKKSDLVQMCAERGIETDEKDKQALIDDLLHWVSFLRLIIRENMRFLQEQQIY